jgi:hypothetical protein
VPEDCHEIVVEPADQKTFAESVSGLHVVFVCLVESHLTEAFRERVRSFVAEYPGGEPGELEDLPKTRQKKGPEQHHFGHPRKRQGIERQGVHAREERRTAPSEIRNESRLMSQNVNRKASEVVAMQAPEPKPQVDVGGSHDTNGQRSKAQDKKAHEIPLV